MCVYIGVPREPPKPPPSTSLEGTPKSPPVRSPPRAPPKEDAAPANLEGTPKSPPGRPIPTTASVVAETKEVENVEEPLNDKLPEAGSPVGRRPPPAKPGQNQNRPGEKHDALRLPTYSLKNLDHLLLLTLNLFAAMQVLPLALQVHSYMYIYIYIYIYL